MAASSQEFWDTAFQKHQDLPIIEPASFRLKGGKTKRAFFQLIGNVDGLDALEVGCGAGDVAVYLAKAGARVTATDFSEVAVEKTAALAKHNGVEGSVDARQLDALQLPELGKHYDLVVGRFILHHVEPFEPFVDVLYDLMKPNGRGVFMENNASNRLLMFARKNVAGRFGIPKHGDDEEHPLEPEEVDLLIRKFAQVEQHYPEIDFFKKLNTYVFRHNRMFGPLMELNIGLDNLLYKTIPGLHKYSYLQLVELKKTVLP